MKVGAYDLPELDEDTPEVLRRLITEAAYDHDRWVEVGGLQTDRGGALDDLISQFDTCLEWLRNAKKTLEEEPA